MRIGTEYVSYHITCSERWKCASLLTDPNYFAERMFYAQFGCQSGWKTPIFFVCVLLSLCWIVYAMGTFIQDPGSSFFSKRAVHNSYWPQNFVLNESGQTDFIELLACGRRMTSMVLVNLPFFSCNNQRQLNQNAVSVDHDVSTQFRMFDIAGERLTLKCSGCLE